MSEDVERVAQAVANLGHTVDVYEGQCEPDDFAIIATSGYPGGRTGLLWGDLHVIREHIERAALTPND